jgi:hypothetical protein
MSDMYTGRLNRVTVDPGGTYAVTCSDDNTARVWDLDTGACLNVLQVRRLWTSPWIAAALVDTLEGKYSRDRCCSVASHLKLGSRAGRALLGRAMACLPIPGIHGMAALR